MDILKGTIAVALGVILWYLVINAVSVNCIDILGNKACAVVIKK